MRSLPLLALALFALAVSASPNAPRHVIYERTTFPSVWRLAGFPQADDKVRVTFALFQRNLDELEKRFWAVSDPDSPQYQQFMTGDEIQDLVAPPAHEAERVVNWLVASGVPSSSILNRRTNIRAVMSVKVASTLFETEFFVFKHAQLGRTVIRQLGPFSLPKDIKAVVEMVTGVTDFPMPPTPKRIVNGDDAIVPQTLFALYNVSASASASNTSQGVAEFGAGEYYSPQSLQTFAQQMGISIRPLNSSHVINPLPPAGIEGTLDIQYIAALGRQSDNWYWTENDWLYEFGTDFVGRKEVPDVVSISYGWSEDAQCDITDSCSTLGVDSEGYVKLVNTEFQKIGLRGTALLCASGDSGANDRTDPDCTDDRLHPTFPAASPYITSVGATQLTTGCKHNLANPPPACQAGSYSCCSGGEETAVSYAQAQFASGGGFSDYAPRPSYQNSAVSGYLNSGVTLPPSSMFTSTGRGIPDVAALGSSILIYSEDEGGIIPVGGTSASSPEIAGIVSLLNQVSRQKTGKPLGFMNPLFYKMASDQPTTFRDITIGDNICTEDGCASTCKGFLCAQGWDPVTGLGVPNTQAMIKYVQNM